MKVGDLVRYKFVPHPYADEEVNLGVILELSKTGHITFSARVHFINGETEWYDTGVLEIIDGND